MQNNAQNAQGAGGGVPAFTGAGAAAPQDDL